MDTFRDYLDRWEEMKGDIQDNNFFYFDRSVAEVRGVEEIGLFRPCTEYRSSDDSEVGMILRGLKSEDFSPEGFEAISRGWVGFMGMTSGDNLLVANRVREMLDYCVERELKCVWTDQALKVIARNGF